MYHNDDYDEFNKGKSIIGISAVCFSVILIIVLIVILVNDKKIGNRSTVSVDNFSGSFVSSIKEDDSDVKKNVDELAFFKNFFNKDTESSVSKDVVENQTTNKTDITNDGKHTLIVYQDGTTEWAEILPYLPMNDYDVYNLINSDGKMKYYEDNVCVSFLGADISDEDEKVDFSKLKKAGCDYVMLRVGVRGYQNGVITIDKNFENNLKKAQDAGLEVGLYFMSQATSVDEANAEAKKLCSYLKNSVIRYPIAFAYEYTGDDSSRIETLTRSEKTKIVQAFCKYIKNEGYTPMIYGSKAWLIKYLDLSKLGDYDIWLSQPDNELPDYPYKYSMWQYTFKGSISGISKDAHLNISFIDYTKK